MKHGVIATKSLCVGKDLNSCILVRGGEEAEIRTNYNCDNPTSDPGISDVIMESTQIHQEFHPIQGRMLQDLGVDRRKSVAMFYIFLIHQITCRLRHKSQVLFSGSSMLGTIL